MAKRKYCKSGEEPVRYECTKQKCKWQGYHEEKGRTPFTNGGWEDICPKCSNPEFYGLLS